MTFKHGVYTSEVETALQAAPAVDSALPYVVGAAVKSFPPTVVSTWRQFVEVSGIREGVDDVPGEDGWHKLSLVSFAYLWFRVCGRGDCILRGVESADGSLSLSQISDALDDIDTTYERVRRLPSILLVPYFGGSPDVWALLKSKAELYGGRFRAVALGDVQCTTHALSGVTPEVISDPSDVGAAKTVTSPAFALLWPYVGIGSMRFDLSSICAAVMNRVDAQNGNLPFVSPSNKNAYATGVYVMPDSTKSETISGCSVNELGCAIQGGAPLTAHYDDPTASASASGLTVERADAHEIPFTESSYASGNGRQWNFSLTGVSGNGTVHVSGTFQESIPYDADVEYSSGGFQISLDNASPNSGQCDVVITDPVQAWHVSGSSIPETFSVSVSYSFPSEVPLFQSRDEVNSALGANGIIGVLNTADGWVVMGNNTTVFPGNTDVKDNMLPIRRMFNYTQNLFQVFAQPRIDNPLNRRQLEGVVNSFNQVLASLQGFGALNSASVSLDDERNTTEQLIRGVVYFRIRIAPPPPMQEVEGVFEFDVEGFEASLA